MEPQACGWFSPEYPLACRRRCLGTASQWPAFEILVWKAPAGLFPGSHFPGTPGFQVGQAGAACPFPLTAEGGGSLLLTCSQAGAPPHGCGTAPVLPITGKATPFLRQVLRQSRLALNFVSNQGWSPYPPGSSLPRCLTYGCGTAPGLFGAVD